MWGKKPFTMPQADMYNTTSVLNNTLLSADLRNVAGHMLMRTPSKYAEFSLVVQECDGGFVVNCGASRHVIKSLDEISGIAVAYMATRALERDGGA